MDRFAVITAHNRPEMLAATVAAIGPQVDAVIIVDNASCPPVRADQLAGDRTWVTLILPVDEQPPNLSRNWNVGIRAAVQTHEAATLSGQPYVAVLGDDTIPPPGWFARVTEAMASTGAVVGCSNPWGGLHPPRVKTQPDRNLGERMPGWAWILDPLSPVRPDERLRWWWGDTDVDWQGRLAGGMVMVSGAPVANVEPDHWIRVRPELAAQARLDGATFGEKWSAYGGCPW